MANYQTPGVYVEEIPKLPPSVAQVATAIPAFIGYTEKASDAEKDLHMVPKKIGSMVEFELYYGYGPAPDVTEINIDSSNNFVSAIVSNKYYLYDSLQMFFANGGGDCFIVSVGIDFPAIDKQDFLDGVDALEKEDEPTIILFPDAVGLNDDDIASVQQAALSQCGTLKDRVGLFDVKLEDPKGINFRNKVGINDLSYGAVYTPWLKVSLPKTVKYPDVTAIKKAGIDTTLSGLTTDAEIQAKIGEVEQAYDDVETIDTQTQSLVVTGIVLGDRFAALESDFNGDNTSTNLQALFDFVYSIGEQIDSLVTSDLTYPTLISSVTSSVNGVFDELLTQVRMLENEVVDIPSLSYTSNLDLSNFDDTLWDDLEAATGKSSLIDGSLTVENQIRISALNSLRSIFDNLENSYYKSIVNTAANFAKTADESLSLVFPVYQTIKTGIEKSMTQMPPSGAIAGIYAMVDRTRGVWKAPANVSLSNVIGPTTIFSKSELDGLNVDAVAGKSINAIRPFFGKGTLVFGARTLAGNNNEWRYISVRRFFNMVEESTKKASEQFVFEPNDANTWVKVQGMIDNFLNTLWKQGALQGAKPEHAYYVAVGLGKTMTALDILEGRMIVEIGMAVVRPAEFIILRFSHKLAES